MKNTIFRGAAAAVVTPMNADGSVNWSAFETQLEFLIDGGIDAVVAVGTTGEASTLTDEEHVEIIRFCVKKTAGRVPVVAGAGSNDTAYAIWLSKEAKQAGANALLHVTPYYNKTTQSGLVRHFNAIADSTDLPVILYNVPSRTGFTIKPETYVELAKHPNIVATKEAGGDISAVAKTAALTGGELDIYSGNDDQIVPLMSLGGIGVISVLANIMPRETHEICQLFFEGRIKESSALQLKLLDLCDALFCEVNPIPVKAALDMMGRAAGPCRLPLCEMEEKNRETLRRTLENHKLI